MILRTVLFCLTWSLLSVPVWAQKGWDSFPYLAEITSDQVNIRAGQSSNFERIIRADKGDEVVVVDRQFSWVKIRLPQEADVYVAKKYMQVLDSSHAQTLTDHLNVRVKPDTNSTIVGQLDKSDIVVVRDVTDEWLKIEPTSKVFGWLSEEFVSFKSVQVPRDSAAVAFSPKIEEKKVPEKPKESLSAQITAKGIIQSNDPGGTFPYKLVDENQKEYNLQMDSSLIKHFLHYKVSVEGNIQSIEPNSGSVLIISNIQLVL
jgi:uncharacterized protein YgiM (DUF1202 family)